ncbi:hypothetical protein OHA25_07215 [Nonomuraea sp. NBC_00507]|uniref:hypothetical protein n=1 Tax=Nonomuraea sp. NBC_00507 TaxID=2976002 RepID=UPI002E1818E2
MAPEVGAERWIGDMDMAGLSGQAADGRRLDTCPGDPLGGEALADGAAHDVTGESREQVVANASS